MNKLLKIFWNGSTFQVENNRDPQNLISYYKNTCQDFLFWQKVKKIKLSAIRDSSNKPFIKDVNVLEERGQQNVMLCNIWREKIKNYHGVRRNRSVKMFVLKTRIPIQTTRKVSAFSVWDQLFYCCKFDLLLINVIFTFLDWRFKVLFNFLNFWTFLRFVANF